MSSVSPRSSASNGVASCDGVSCSREVVGDLRRCLELVVQLAQDGLVDKPSLQYAVSQLVTGCNKAVGVVPATDSPLASSVASRASSARSGSASPLRRSVSPLSVPAWRLPAVTGVARSSGRSVASATVLTSSGRVLRGALGPQEDKVGVGRDGATGGYCYARALSSGKPELGSGPTVYDLLALPASKFVSDVELGKLRIALPVLGMAHVGDSGEPVLDVLTALAQTSVMPYTGPDSMWSKLRDRPKCVVARGYTHSMRVGQTYGQRVCGILRLSKGAAMEIALDRLASGQAIGPSHGEVGELYLQICKRVATLKAEHVPWLANAYALYQRGMVPKTYGGIVVSNAQMTLAVETVGAVYIQLGETAARQLVREWEYHFVVGDDYGFVRRS